MFCPACKCEYRSGFTRCDACEVDLVESLESGSGAAGYESGELLTDPGPMVDFCGFLSLGDAREARDTVWARGMPAEIAIRPTPGSRPGGGLEEEFWLRVGMKTFRMVSDLLGYDTAEAETTSSENLRCSDCGLEVAAEETFCPGCGSRFEEA